MKKLKPLISLISITALSLSLLSGCNTTEKVENELQTVRLSEVVHSIFYAPQYVALSQGYFEEEGLSIELSVGQGADTSMTQILSNSADIALLGTEAGIYVYNEGKENFGVPFAQLTQRAGNFLVSREDNPDFEWTDLKGSEIIGCRAGGMPQLILEYIIKENGMEIGTDIDMINNIDFTSTAGAFVGEIGDYTAEFEPTASTLEAQGNGYIVASLGEASGFVPYTVYMATKDYIAENPEIIQKFTNAIYKGQQYIYTHTSKEIAEVCLPFFEESDVETLEKVIERYKVQDTWKENPIFDPDGFTLIQDIMEEGGELEKRIDFNDFVNTEFAEKSVSK